MQTDPRDVQEARRRPRHYRNVSVTHAASDETLGRVCDDGARRNRPRGNRRLRG